MALKDEGSKERFRTLKINTSKIQSGYKDLAQTQSAKSKSSMLNLEKIISEAQDP